MVEENGSGCEWVDGRRRLVDELQIVQQFSSGSVRGRIKGLEFELKL